MDAVAFDEGLLLHQRTHRTVHVLNATAAAVWTTARGGRTPDEVVDEVAARFDLSPAAVADDVDRTLAELGAAGLLDAEPPLAAVATARVTAAIDGTGDGAATAGDVGEADPGDGEPLRVRLLHLGVAVHGPEPALAPLRPLLAGLATDPDTDRPVHRCELRPADAGPGTWLVSLDGRTTHGPASLESAHRHVLWQLNHEAIAAEGQVLVLHAGGAIGADGAVAVAGEPDAGKSTLTAALCRAGLAYATDEAVAVDAGGRVLPYPKPLTLDAGSLELLALGGESVHAGHLAPAAVGATAPGPAPLAAVVLPDRRPGARPVPEHLAPTEAALALAGVAFNLPAVGRSGLATLARLAEEVPVVRLPVDDPAEAAEVVAGLVGGPPSAADG